MSRTQSTFAAESHHGEGPSAPPHVEIAMNGTLFALHNYWLKKRGTRHMPARKDIEPLEIASLLPYVLLLDVHDGRLHYRLAGSATVELFGRDPTGKFLDEILPEARYKIAARSYVIVLEQGRPLISRSKFIAGSGATAMITRLVLPLSDDDEQTN